MHWDLLKYVLVHPKLICMNDCAFRYFRESTLKQMLLNVSFSLPFILVILWIKPVARDYLTIRVFSGRTEPL